LTIKSIRDVYSYFIRQLKDASIEDPDVELLFAIRHVIGYDYISLLGQSYEVTNDQFERLAHIVKLRIQRVPLAYILGEKNFFGRDYYVHEGVLIPRPETEEMVQYLDQFIQKKTLIHRKISIFELGLGTGVISLELASRFQQINFFGWDISRVAIENTIQNMDRFNVTNLTVIEGDFFNDFIEYLSQDSFNLLIANPPYISEDDYLSLSEEVLKEPKSALVAPNDGLAIIICALRLCIKYNVSFVCEIGYDQRSKIELQFPDIDLGFVQDLSDHDRFLVYLAD